MLNAAALLIDKGADLNAADKHVQYYSTSTCLHTSMKLHLLLITYL